VFGGRGEFNGRYSLKQKKKDWGGEKKKRIYSGLERGAEQDGHATVPILEKKAGKCRRRKAAWYGKLRKRAKVFWGEEGKEGGLGFLERQKKNAKGEIQRGGTFFGPNFNKCSLRVQLAGRGGE